jgi:lipoprotein-anchoring transpeptidase ErfK/SrfK
MLLCRSISIGWGLIGWGTAAWLLGLNSPAVMAQVAPEPIVQPQPLELATHLRAYMPSLQLPPIQPLWPEIRETRLVLKLGERRVYVYHGNQVEASFPVAVGKPGWETPVGTYEVLSMLQNPGWISPFTGEEIPPGPDNPLGTRWIGFWTDGQNFIGFHGTPTRNSVGRAASHGCVRMFNEDILQLFEWVRLGTPVVVEN